MGQIQPENALERAFLDAFRDPALRPGFRRELLTAQVALALANTAPDSPPRMMQVREDLSVGLIYSSATRLAGVLGPAAPRAMMTGRQALTRLAGQHVAFNLRLVPMLTLEPEDIAEYLAT
ncbi:hypothetical protein U91I_02186 [alpha proteobacterium U9-1i]|nr:hypothetical protein U91I_02186 [alpha proteobacterium U9-1i]